MEWFKHISHVSFFKRSILNQIRHVRSYKFCAKWNGLNISVLCFFTYMTYRFKLFKCLHFSPQIERIERICPVFLNLENYKKKSAGISGISGKKNGRELSARNLYALYVYIFKCLNFGPQI